jgi:uncharacterized membrane protein
MTDVMLVVHFIGLAMGVGTSFAFMFIGIAASKMPPEEGGKFQKNALTISTMGHIGLALLVISGLYLITDFWAVLGENPILIAKLVLVIALGAVIGIVSSKAKKAIRENNDEKLKKIAPLGKIALLLALAIIILAVLQFH